MIWWLSRIRGEFDEFDLNTFFEATGSGEQARFVHESDVQKWLDLIRGEHAPTQMDMLKAGGRPPFPYADARLLPYLQHSFWYLPNVAACQPWQTCSLPGTTLLAPVPVIVAAGSGAGVGVEALPPVREAIGDGHDTKPYALVRQTDNRGDRQAMVLDPHAAQPHQPGVLLPGRFPGTVPVGDQELTGMTQAGRKSSNQLGSSLTSRPPALCARSPTTALGYILRPKAPNMLSPSSSTTCRYWPMTVPQ